MAQPCGFTVKLATFYFELDYIVLNGGTSYSYIVQFHTRIYCDLILIYTVTSYLYMVPKNGSTMRVSAFPIIDITYITNLH